MVNAEPETSPAPGANAAAAGRPAKAAAGDDGTENAVREFARRLLDMGISDLTPQEKRLIRRMAKRHAVSRDLSVEFDSSRSFGERLADQVAEVGGSWGFIIGFGIVIVVWVILNTLVLTRWIGAFDPYPFVFLNLMLSLVAAVQAPIIMMSQNRQAQKDRLEAAHDYEVNLKAELEIMALHDKLDDIRARDIRAIVERLESAGVLKALEGGGDPA
ncbi:Uncharacterized membrane protein [Pseudoxanthobacter soli DSM 19599]|uniref:Uncharacterized membrane protein n=2 Tax=Pseudoxanthobacter TaxID=433838 RepID=A0A1M7Z5T1_9HYPH|nr:Uncharacterized membrane protein [Pseudoxanthobacter soli DSM 19599]